jgi:phosphoribosylamine--glycine ligase
VVIERKVVGHELSLFAITDGARYEVLAQAEDHKAIFDGDEGPNTGGMGTVSPCSWVTGTLLERVERDIFRPTLSGLAAEGNPYTGFLYAGLMISADGTPKVIEYNCRFGDPETQPILMRLRSDLVALCLAALEGRLDQVQAEWDPRPALGVVMAAGGYPDAYEKDHPITGLEGLDGPDLKVFHAGTRLDGDRLVTAGGRVLCVTALGDTVGAAQGRAYGAVHQIRWQDAYYRGDIGHRAIAREGTA